MEVIGRTAELQTIQYALTSEHPQLIAVWGRRRVGKTFLIRYGRKPVEDWYFELTGQRNGVKRIQLARFTEALFKTFQRGITSSVPPSWEEAFKQLEAAIEVLPEDGKPVTVFFDEAPWLDSRRSGFLDALEYFWNAKGTRIPRLKMFVSGSAASWVVHKIVNGKGGWHRRVTGRMRVPQFKLHEVAAYLAHREIRPSQTDILKLYMVLGGVPYYLSFMRRGESIATFIERLFFRENAELQGEFDELFDSLFTNSQVHKKIIASIAKTKDGLRRADIAASTKLPSGGKLTEYIDNLKESGFIEMYRPLGARGERYSRYRICDMFTLFHLQWLADGTEMRSWHAVAHSQAYKSWCGHAFEILVWNHARCIAAALGIAKSDYSVTRADLENGAGKGQIDLLFDVRGGAVYLLEIKFCDTPYAMTAAEAAKIQQRKHVLSEHHKGRRSIIVCLLAPAGVESNAHSKETVDMVLDAVALFREEG